MLVVRPPVTHMPHFHTNGPAVAGRALSAVTTPASLETWAKCAYAATAGQSADAARTVPIGLRLTPYWRLQAGFAVKLGTLSMLLPAPLPHQDRVHGEPAGRDSFRTSVF